MTVMPQRYFSANFEEGEEQPEHQEEKESEPELEAIPEYENIIARREEGGVGFIQLNRPKALNALNYALFKDLIDALRLFERDPTIGCIVLTGSEKSFAAGADIKEMQLRTFPDTYMTDMLSWWNEIPKVRTPIVGAINGFALGGGCELAQMCDILYAGDRARFGQPEIKLGVIPGMGGS
jgi:enoyl-CoA hydratase